LAASSCQCWYATSARRRAAIRRALGWLDAASASARASTAARVLWLGGAAATSTSRGATARTCVN
jgi:hypothetical protein